MDIFFFSSTFLQYQPMHWFWQLDNFSFVQKKIGKVSKVVLILPHLLPPPLFEHLLSHSSLHPCYENSLTTTCPFCWDSSFPTLHSIPTRCLLLPLFISSCQGCSAMKLSSPHPCQGSSVASPHPIPARMFLSPHLTLSLPGLFCHHSPPHPWQETSVTTPNPFVARILLSLISTPSLLGSLLPVRIFLSPTPTLSLLGVFPHPSPPHPC